METALSHIMTSSKDKHDLPCLQLQNLLIASYRFVLQDRHVEKLS